MKTDAPHIESAAVCHAYGYWLWRVDGQPEVWHRVPKKFNKVTGKETPAHWDKIGGLAQVGRQDAKQTLTAAWEDEVAWREAYK